MVAEGLNDLAIWHAGWAGATIAATLASLWLGHLGGAALFGAVAMVIPGLAGLGLLWRDGTGERSLVLVVWTVCALAAAILSGGLGGPLVGAVAMPFVAALALGGPRHGAQLAQGGAVGAAVAALGGQLSAWGIGAPEAQPMLAGGSALPRTARSSCRRWTGPLQAMRARPCSPRALPWTAASTWWCGACPTLGPRPA